MYEYRRRENKVKKVFITILLMLIVAAVSIFIYDMYVNIDVYSSEQQNQNVGATRVSYTQEIKASSNDDITNTLENTIKGVVGISKIKNKGNSIFLNNSTESLGLGTGMIVSENGYILTNWHVAGDKYSKCYVTLENSKVENGSVVWADKDLDLAILKINATN